MMELADVTDSKSVGSDTVRVRPPPSAPAGSACIHNNSHTAMCGSFHFLPHWDNPHLRMCSQVLYTEPAIFSFSSSSHVKFCPLFEGGAAAGGGGSQNRNKIPLILLPQRGSLLALLVKWFLLIKRDAYANRTVGKIYTLLKSGSRYLPHTCSRKIIPV